MAILEPTTKKARRGEVAEDLAIILVLLLVVAGTVALFYGFSLQLETQWPSNELLSSPTPTDSSPPTTTPAF